MSELTEKTPVSETVAVRIDLDDLLGVNASRRVRQHDGDSDVIGVPGWSIEVRSLTALGIEVPSSPGPASRGEEK